MTVFTIETTYRLPVYRHQTYEAATMDEACRLAVDDDDWSDGKTRLRVRRRDLCDGHLAWRERRLQRGRTADSLSHVETPQRIALHFEVLLGLVKVLASQNDSERLDRTFWLERAQPAIAKAEAILAGGHEPD